MSRAAVIDVAVYRRGAVVADLCQIDNELEPLQAIVGGYLEPVKLPGGLLLLCNEDGISRGLPVSFYAIAAYGVPIPIRGDFFVCRVDGSEFASIGPGDLERLFDLVRPA